MQHHRHGLPKYRPVPPAVPRRDNGGWPTTAVPFPRRSPTEILGNSTPRGGVGNYCRASNNHQCIRLPEDQRQRACTVLVRPPPATFARAPAPIRQSTPGGATPERLHTPGAEAPGELCQRTCTHPVQSTPGGPGQHACTLSAADPPAAPCSAPENFRCSRPRRNYPRPT